MPETQAAEEPIYDLAHLGHVELLTPRFDESLAFFLEVYGLTMVAVTGSSVYLRGWGDHDLSTLKLTAAPVAGLGHVGWRTTSAAALARRVSALRNQGVAGEWIDGDIGHGAAFQFRSPSGQLMEIYYESERYVASEDSTSYLLNQPQSSVSRGVGAARIDHLNVLAGGVPEAREFMSSTLGFKLRERLVPPGAPEVGAWMSLMNKAHDLAITREPVAGQQGRRHHIAYAVEDSSAILRAADLFMELGTPIEFGPAKHLRTQGFFLYVLEPGGNRVELIFGGLHITAPDWEPVTWNTESEARSTAWGQDVPETFHTHATPVV